MRNFLKQCVAFTFVIGMGMSFVQAVTNVQSAVACEHETIQLECKENHIINILDANYGRTTKETCKTEAIYNVTCYTDEALSIVSDVCEGQSECSVQASNNVFGDPCPRTVKYLFVLYECLAVTDFKTALSCEHETAQLECGSGEVIQVLEASYGRNSRLTCAADKPIKTTNCRNQESMTITSKRCNNRRHCEIDATNSVFGDPCVGTYKYLYIKYKCIKGNAVTSGQNSDIATNSFYCKNGSIIKETEKCDGVRDCPDGDDELSCGFVKKHACEGSVLRINCNKKGETIKIINGNYGRLSRKRCPQKGLTRQDTHCKSSNTINILRDRCERKKSCEVRSENEVFGDPCYGIHKYIEVQYQCAKASDEHHSINPRSV